MCSSKCMYSVMPPPTPWPLGGGYMHVVAGGTRQTISTARIRSTTSQITLHSNALVTTNRDPSFASQATTSIAYGLAAAHGGHRYRHTSKCRSHMSSSWKVPAASVTGGCHTHHLINGIWTPTPTTLLADRVAMKALPSLKVLPGYF